VAFGPAAGGRCAGGAGRVHGGAGSRFPRVGQTERRDSRPRLSGNAGRAFLLLLDEGTQEATAFWDKFSQDTLWIGGEFNVGISGVLGRRVIGDDYQELLRQIRAAAAQAAATGERQAVEYAGARLMILPSAGHDYQLNGAVEESRGWPRTESKLVKKARQALALAPALGSRTIMRDG
jgi:hypothetical protein